MICNHILVWGFSMECNWEVTDDYFNERVYRKKPNLCDIVNPLGEGLVEPIAERVDKKTATIIINAVKAYEG